MDENGDLVGENGDSAGDRKWFDEWTLWFCSAREIGDLPEHNHISCCCWLGSNRSNDILLKMYCTRCQSYNHKICQWDFQPIWYSTSILGSWNSHWICKRTCLKCSISIEHSSTNCIQRMGTQGIKRGLKHAHLTNNMTNSYNICDSTKYDKMQLQHKQTTNQPNKHTNTQTNKQTN